MDSIQGGGLLFKTLVYFAIFFGSLAANGEVLVSVERADFEKGKSWEWLYSQWNEKTREWTPYYTEKYQVVEVDGPLITIEMSSSSGLSSPDTPHHMFMIDFQKCERAAKNPSHKNFHVTLYTKSLSEDWQLVSHNHEHLIFTEKFNCAQPFKEQKVISREHEHDGIVYLTSQIMSNPPKSSSWYFVNHPAARGVLAFKLMGPLGQYKIEMFTVKFPGRDASRKFNREHFYP